MVVEAADLVVDAADVEVMSTEQGRRSAVGASTCQGMALKARLTTPTRAWLLMPMLNVVSLPLVRGCQDLGEAFRRIRKGVAAIDTMGKINNSNVVKAVCSNRSVKAIVEGMNTRLLAHQVFVGMFQKPDHTCPGVWEYCGRLDSGVQQHAPGQPLELRIDGTPLPKPPPEVASVLVTGEGGCGACVVLLSTYYPVTEQVKDFFVSSCLTLVYDTNFCSVMTTEGLGNSNDGSHSVHERFARFHASQFGFCTPGMCMSLVSALVNADKSERPEPPDGFSKLTSCEGEKAIAGNLCLCTGYRPIVDACESFAADVELEDLGLNSFWKKGDKDADVAKPPHYTNSSLCTFPEFLKSEIKSSLKVDEHTSSAETCWHHLKVLKSFTS